MCGICGTVYFGRGRQAERSVLEAMNRVIYHRGPDDEGYYLSGAVGLAMRRLSIIDLQTGQQPVTNEDGSIWIIFNGEIYNHSELRAQLEPRGHRYHTKSDTETIVHLYEEYGHDCVQHLRGMFAFALWDSRRRKLFIARDRLGIKPLYYRLTAESLLFGSEIKAILAHPEVHVEMNREGLPEYLAFGYLAGEDTFFRGIRKLLPGHWMEVEEAGHVTIQEYWDLKPPAEAAEHPEKYYVDGYRELLEQAVGGHLMSDVPLGMFLSGGLDSSTIAAMMTKIRREPIETFSVGYHEEAYSELAYARTVAEHINSLHHEVRITRQDFFDALPKLIWHEDEPLAWPSSVSLYFVSKLARERVIVVLTGEGSDETLGGYARYAWTLWNLRLDKFYRGLTPAALRRGVRNLLADSKLLGADLRRKLQHTFLGRDGSSLASLYFDNFYAAIPEAAQQNLLADGLRPESGGSYRDTLAYWERSSGGTLERLLYVDIKTYLVELCMKQDQMSMAASVESRVPFLDHKVVEFAMAIPARLKTRGLSGKRILKTAVRDLLPASIIDRKKMGFPTPISNWLLGPQLDEIERMLLEPRALSRGLFRAESLRQRFAEHRAGLRDNTDCFWRLLNLELWQRVFVDRDPALRITHAGGESAVRA